MKVAIPNPDVDALRKKIEAMPIGELIEFALRGARAQKVIDKFVEALNETKDPAIPGSISPRGPVLGEEYFIGRGTINMRYPLPKPGVKRGWKKANGQPGASCTKCGAQDGTVMQKRCKACRAAAPSASVPPSRLNQSRDGVPLNARGTPRPACTGCGARNGRVRMGRCEDCRKNGKGKVLTGRRYRGKAKTSPPLPTHKRSKIRRSGVKWTKPESAQADSSTEEKKQGPFSDTWIAAFKARAAVMPKLLTSWGVGPIVKLLSAGGRPLYEKLPPVLRKEVTE